MQLPITVGLHRSFFLASALAASHVLAALVIGLPPWTLAAKILLLTFVGASALLAWRLRPEKVTALRLLRDGRLECQLTGSQEFQAADLLPGATVHPWLTVIHLRVAGGRVVVAVLPDSAVAADYRRLRMWLRWQARFKGAMDRA